MHRFFPLLTLTLLATASAQTTASFVPADWPALERIARKVPAFAGFTWGEQHGKQVLRLALTDPRQENALRSALKNDPYWTQRAAKWNLGTGAVSMQTPVSHLLEVGRQVQKERPNATLRIDTAFGKVRLNAPAEFTRLLAAKVRVGSLLVNDDWRPPLTVSYDVQPRTVSLGRIPKVDRFATVGKLRVTVRNTGLRVVEFGYGCGGNLPVGVVTASGGKVPEIGGIACTQEARFRLIQPGETVTFPSFSWNDLRKLKPGKYAWFYDSKKFPFTLTR